jgi:hypothetical protein
MQERVKIPVKPFKKLPAFSEERQNVGARNPYALADAVLGERKDWQRMGIDEKKNVLERALRRPFAQLFDPAHKSPLFSRQVMGDVPEEEVITKAGSPCTSAAVSPWAPLGGSEYFKDPLANQCYVCDPVQGCGVDCYLVAACGSLSWVSPQLLPYQAGPTYTYSFWNLSTNKKETVTVDNRLPLDASGQCVYARSSNPFETWPPLIEKAYGIWKQLPGAANGEPDLAKDTGGNPVTSLTQIAKGVTSTYASTTVTTASCGYKWSTMLSKIWSRFDPANNNCMNITTSKTKVPMVGYTYVSAAQAPAGKGVSYSTDTIVANHSYSVLGLYKYNNKCSIVLRNPYGPLAGDPALAGSLASGTWSIPTNRYYLKGGAVNTTIRADSFSVNLADNDGTFALDTDVFMTHFQALGYIA